MRLRSPPRRLWAAPALPGTADLRRGWRVPTSSFLCSLVNCCRLTRIRALEVITQKTTAFKKKQNKTKHKTKQHIGCRLITSEVGHVPIRVFGKALLQPPCVHTTLQPLLINTYCFCKTQPDPALGAGMNGRHLTNHFSRSRFSFIVWYGLLSYMLLAIQIFFWGQNYSSPWPR